MRQKRWIELFSDYECEIRYHLGDVRTIIMDETHASRYLVYPGADKTYYDLGDMHWWPCMKKDVATYVSNCRTCSKQGMEFWCRSSEIVMEDLLCGFCRRCKSVRNTTRYEYGLSSLNGCTNFPKTIFITRVYDVLHLRYCMEGDERLKAARDRQKSYADNRRKPLEFEVSDQVLLKVSPWKGVMHFGKKGKLAPRYVGPFEILERIGPVAYRLRLPEELSGEVKIDKTLCFVEEPVVIMDREVKKLKCSRILIVKVR
ncbi:putative reverse transcriptase domain-containing protein [Tanacetum coccineum]